MITFYNKVIDIYIDESGNEFKTSNFKIHYSKR
ncbi:polymorphic toxin type 50 domain-containing protein [Caloranaerobacter azorensis]|uniref:Uncharacterized protein n=1 Tax=Caloranaerobacter azorensis TaxID=116090 RepID=A0A6P1YFY2_9FIRM|nr:hypothetical protein G3A45_07130 [Caloranaerobacter azorensis]